ncbi:hypothetical protein ACJJTC_002622 [Scirpophaga incertulas]
MLTDIMGDKKKKLLAYKESILKEIDYYQIRIDEVRRQGKKSIIYDTDSSDSEAELFPFNIDDSPSTAQLKEEHQMLKTCLQATEELTSLQILESEVNILKEVPEFQGVSPVEDGIWREVTAECRVDLVPFTISFFVHQPTRKFSSPWYRGLQVVSKKAAHEAELKKSILPNVWKPSDAVEVLKSYSAAHRSRRTTLARLAEKYAASLHMEPMSDGGYLLKCAELLQVVWSLQNKWSPVAPFHHRLKFDLEYMDESYIKIITQTHSQLSDPSIETDERTFLLSKIIATCLEAQGPTQELYESMSSDPESARNIRKRRTTLDQEPEAPAVKGRRKDSEVMAPPKSLPKRAKPKPKENTVENRKARRDTEEGAVNAKKSRNNDDSVRVSDDRDSGSADDRPNDKAVNNKENTGKKHVDKVKEGVNKISEKQSAKKLIDKNKATNINNLLQNDLNNDGKTKNLNTNKSNKNKENTQKIVKENSDLKTGANVKQGNKQKTVAKSNENKKSVKENTDQEKKINKEKDSNANVKSVGPISKKSKPNTGVNANDNVDIVRINDSKKTINRVQDKNNINTEQINVAASSMKVKEDGAKQANSTTKKNNRENINRVTDVTNSKKTTIEKAVGVDVDSSKKSEYVVQSINAKKNTVDKAKQTNIVTNSKSNNGENLVATQNKNTGNTKKNAVNTKQGNNVANNIHALNKASNKVSKENAVNKAKKIDSSEHTVEKVTQFSSGAVKRKTNLVDRVDKENDAVVTKKHKLAKPENVKKLQDKDKPMTTSKNTNQLNVAKKITPIKPKPVAGTTSADKASKLPVKKITSAVNLTKNPQLTLKPASTSQKTKATNIPRLMK